MTTRNEFSEALALARLVAEKTGCGLEQALGALVRLSGGESREPLEATLRVAIPAKDWLQPQPERKTQLPRSAPLPENILNFISTCPVGSKKTVAEIYAACGLEMPRNGKRLSYLLQREGWEANGERRKNLRVFVKLEAEA